MINVLVVDDDRLFIEEVCDYFKNDTDICISNIAYDGEEAIKYISDEIDIIILGLIMPKKDGYGVLRYLKENKIHKKVVIVSSLNITSMINLIDVRIDYLFLKPVNYSDLKNVLLDINKINIRDAHNAFTNKLTKLLSDLGLPSNIYGFHFIRYAITYVYDNDYIDIPMNKIYEEVSKKYKTSKENVERCIRHAIDISWTRGDLDVIDDIFGSSVDINKAKPTNSEYIYTIADRLRIK
jgi:two-component system response regulator (stage 0 sporulation protein A)